MRRAPRIACVGEAIVDFFAPKKCASLSSAPEFIRYPGGAAANVAVGIARLGARSAFVGAVGGDPFGRFLRSELARNGVDVAGVKFMKEFGTRLAFVSVSADGDRDFRFWERVPADTRLALDKKDVQSLLCSQIVHFSSFLLLDEPSRSTALATARKLHAAGTLVSFDPNLRLSLWQSRSKARALHREMIRRCSILRLNEEEARFLSGKKTPAAAAENFHAIGPAVVVITRARRGAYISTPRGATFVPGFGVTAVDTTGCGDAFLAALLTGVALERRPIGEIPLATWRSVCLHANAAGAIAATRQGGISSLPDKRHLEKFLREHAS